MRKRKFYLTENGKAMLVTAPVSLFAFEVLARGGTLGLAAAGAATFVAARHGGAIKNGVSRMLSGLVSPRERNNDEEEWPDEEETLAPARQSMKRLSRRATSLPTEEEVEAHLQRYNQEMTDSDDFDIPQFRSGMFTFSELLATGWRPSMDEIFLARLPDGTNVFIPVDKLVHIALSGATRNGKTSIIRKLLSQMIYVGSDCLLLDPHYTPYDIDTGEDWTPFASRLRRDPMECKEYNRINEVIEHAATVILPKRKKLRAESKPVGKYIFIVIDEYPSVVGHCGKVFQKHIADLLREGGKYKIILCIASHDFQVQTAFPGMGGGLRDQFKTVFHVGGDIYTVNALLDMVNVDRDEEASLGKGLAYLRCETHKRAGLAYTPWMDNDAIYTLVGPRTYVPTPANADEDEPVDFGRSFHRESAEPAEQGQTPNEPHSNVTPMPTPIMQDKGPRAEDIGLAAAITLWNSGYDSDRLLAKAFGITKYQGNRLAGMIKDQLKKQAADEVPD